jgi:hypothetical protein
MLLTAAQLLNSKSSRNSSDSDCSIPQQPTTATAKAPYFPLSSLSTHLDNTMSSNNNLTILLALMPVLVGVPSCRHFVVIRRAEAHLQAIHNILVEMQAKAVAVGVSNTVTPCITELIANKISLVDGAIDELEKRTSKARRAQVAARLVVLKRERKALRDRLEM